MSLNTIISSFSTDDYTKVISFLHKKNRRTDVKNIQLFKLLYANKLTSDEICNHLYPNKKKDAYHALRKRLYNSLIDFSATLNLEEENSDKVKIIKYIIVARSFLQQQKIKLALSLLEKAEVIAKEYQLYLYLNEIYHLKIQFFHTNNTKDLDQLITDFKKNQQLYFVEEELNIVYAKIRQILQKVAFDGEIINFKKVVYGILKEQDITLNDTLSFKSLYQLLTIASISAFITKDYLEVESFMLDTYELLKEHPNKEKERFYHIQVLYMIANTLFRVKQFQNSKSFLKLMNTEIEKDKRKYYKAFKPQHNLLYALNLNYTNKQEDAIDLLTIDLKQKNNPTETVLYASLSFIVFHFQKGEIKKAYKLLLKLYHTDIFYTKKMGKEWVIKKNLIELLLLIELDYLDVFENRYSRFKRNFSSYLKKIKQERVLIFLKHAEFYYLNPKEFNTKKYLDKIENSFEWIGAKREDIYVMSFYAWLKSKILKEPVYRVTLDLVSKAQEL